MPSSTPEAAIRVAVVSLHRDPDDSSEVVTQALLNTPVEVLEQTVASSKGGAGSGSLAPGGNPDGRCEWMRIRLPDYEGWVEASSLADVARHEKWKATVLPLRTPVYAGQDGDTIRYWAYATTNLPTAGVPGQASGQRTLVRLPGGESGWMDSSALDVHLAGARDPELGPDGAVTLAQQLLGVPYLWGGITVEGVDCSGLTQLCWRAAGVRIPRDADQQYQSIDYIVGRSDLHAGDLIYFAESGRITHTGLMIDPRRYIHARGSPADRVILTGLAPGDPLYDRSLDGRYAGARRPFVRRVRILV